MSSRFPLITEVKTAMPEVDLMSFITAPDSGSWLGRSVQSIKDHPILFAVTAAVIGIIGYGSYTIYKAITNNSSTASNSGDEDLKINPKNVQNKTPAPKAKPDNTPQSNTETLIAKTNSQINISSTANIENSDILPTQHSNETQDQKEHEYREMQPPNEEAIKEAKRRNNELFNDPIFLKDYNRIQKLQKDEKKEIEEIDNYYIDSLNINRSKMISLNKVRDEARKNKDLSTQDLSTLDLMWRCHRSCLETQREKISSSWAHAKTENEEKYQLLYY